MNGGLQKLNELRDLADMLRSSGDPDKVVAMFAKRNRKFAKFLAENKGLSTEQIMEKYGIDPSVLRGIV